MHSSRSLDFIYHIYVAGDKDSAGEESSRKRIRRDDSQRSVSFIWNVFKKCYCSHDPSRPIVDLYFRTERFNDLEYRLFTVPDDYEMGIVNDMVKKVGCVLYGGAEFEEVDEMVQNIRRVIVEAFRPGLRREKLDVMVTVMNQVGMTADEYEAVLRRDRSKLGLGFELMKIDQEVSVSILKLYKLQVQYNHYNGE